MTLYLGYGDNIILHGADALIAHRSHRHAAQRKFLDHRMHIAQRTLNSRVS